MSTTISQVATTQIQTEANLEKRKVQVEGNPSFKAKTANDQFLKSCEVEATTAKKWGVGVASVLPGLGQAINGQWGKAVGFVLGTGGLAAVSLRSIADSQLLLNNFIRKSTPEILKKLETEGISKLAPDLASKVRGKVALGLAAALGVIGLVVTSIVDAVKNAKSTVKVVDEKGLT